MKFLVDACAGGRLALWLATLGHDVLDASRFVVDPGDSALLARAVIEARVMISVDKDIGELIFRVGQQHAGLIRLPDVPAERRIELVSIVLLRYEADLNAGAVVTVKDEHAIRVSRTD